MNEIIMSNEGTFAIVVTCCKDCPFVAANHCGKRYVCNHPSTVTKTPYADQRLVIPTIINSGCVLLPVVPEPVKLSLDEWLEEGGK
jgi:hypothetical protein